MFNFISEWMRYSRRKLAQRAKWDQKVWKLFSPTLEVVYECVCSANEYIYSKWLRPFWPNGCVCSGITYFDRMDVPVWWTDASIQHSCDCSNQMDMSVREYPVLAEWMNLFGEWMCLVRTIMLEQMCLFGTIAPTPIEWMCLHQKASSKFLYER